MSSSLAILLILIIFALYGLWKFSVVCYEAWQEYEKVRR